MSEYKPQAWRMDGYYPESYAKFMAALGIGIDYDDSDFDRYEAEFRADLAAHDRQVAAKAWDEGHRTRWRRGPDNCHCEAWSSSECACGEYGRGELLSLGDNPYRAAAIVSEPGTPAQEGKR